MRTNSIIGRPQAAPTLLSPIVFAEQRLGVQCWPKMREIMQAVADGERKVLVRSCNGAGKTTALAALCNWYLSQFEDSIVLTTASSWMQVRRNLWGEIRKQARKAKLYNDANGNALKLAETAIKLTDKHYMLGIAPDMPENAMGFHAPRMLIAVDEATGVDREIIDALTGNLTGSDAQIVMICNPIDMQSYPYEAEQSGEWRLIAISAFEHPNVESGKETIKGAVTREWIEDRLRSWSYEVDSGERRTEEHIAHDPSNTLFVPWLDRCYRKTPIVAARLLGEWGDTESEGFIGLDLIKASCRPGFYPVTETAGLKRMSDHAGLHLKCLGVDISRGVGGDATVFAFFDGNRQLDFETDHTGDLMRTARRIKAHYDAGFTIIALDDTGLGGGVSDRLKELGVPHFAVNFNQKARGFLRNRKELANARAEMYFVLEEELRNCLNNDVCDSHDGDMIGEDSHHASNHTNHKNHSSDHCIRLLDHKLLHQELAAIRLSTNELATAYKLEDKTLTKQRLGRSPDYADATALARYALRLHAVDKKLKFL